MTHRLRPVDQRGFTLVELLVVFAIAGLLMALVPVAYDKARESAQYRNTLRSMVGELRSARQQAMAQGMPVAFSVNLQQRRFGISSARQTPVPAHVDLRATVGAALLTPDQTASIVFLPDGGATGGSIELVRPSGEGTRLRVDWLTGQLTQERLLP